MGHYRGEGCGIRMTHRGRSPWGRGFCSFHLQSGGLTRGPRGLRGGTRCEERGFSHSTSGLTRSRRSRPPTSQRPPKGRHGRPMRCTNGWEVGVGLLRSRASLVRSRGDERLLRSGRRPHVRQAFALDLRLCRSQSRRGRFLFGSYGVPRWPRVVPGSPPDLKWVRLLPRRTNPSPARFSPGASIPTMCEGGRRGG